MALERIGEGTRLSHAVVHAGVVYLAGQVADDLTLDIAGQTQAVLAKIDRLLAAAKSDKSRLLSVSIWLADIGSKDAMNAVWDAWVAGISPPARACVEAGLGRDVSVEIAAIAASG